MAKYGLVNRKSVTDNYVIFYNLGPPKNWMGKFLRPCITSIASQLQSYAVINWNFRRTIVCANFGATERN